MITPYNNEKIKAIDWIMADCADVQSATGSVSGGIFRIDVVLKDGSTTFAAWDRPDWAHLASLLVRKINAR